MSSEVTNNSGKIWGWAAVAGVLAFLALKFFASYAFWPALLLAILIAILVAILLWIGFYRDADADRIETNSGTAALGAGSSSVASSVASNTDVKPVSKPAPASTSTSVGTAKTAAEPAPKPAAKKPAAKAKPKTTAKSGVRGSASAKTTAKPKTTRKKPAAKASSAVKTTASSLMGDAGNAMVSEKKAEKTKRPPVAKDGKPVMLKAARAGGADDLKQIKGVGPKMEQRLNEMGVYHFDQVAEWRAKEVKWADENLDGVKGRVSRDGWVKQAKVLAKGGQTEFSKRVKKGGVY